MNNTIPIERSDIREVLERHPGSKSRLARRANVTRCAITRWLSGGTSANIERKAARLYRELLSKEDKEIASAV